MSGNNKDSERRALREELVEWDTIFHSAAFILSKMSKEDPMRNIPLETLNTARQGCNKCCNLLALLKDPG
jgi:hypothetical protein